MFISMLLIRNVEETNELKELLRNILLSFAAADLKTHFTPLLSHLLALVRSPSQKI